MTRYLRVDVEPNELVEHAGTGILGSLLTPARLSRRALTGEQLAPVEHRVTEVPEGWVLIAEADNHIARALWAQVDALAGQATVQAELADTRRQLDAAKARTKITRDVLDDQILGLRVDRDNHIAELVKTARKRGHAEGALDANRELWNDIYEQTKQKADAYDGVARTARQHADYIRQLAETFGIATDQSSDDITRDLRTHVEVAARVVQTVMSRAVYDVAIDKAPIYAAEAVNAVGVADDLAAELEQRDQRIAQLTEANEALQATIARWDTDKQRTPGDPLEGIENDTDATVGNDVPPLPIPVGRYKLTTPAMGGPADRLDAAVLVDGTFRIRPKGTDLNSDPETWPDYTTSARKLLARERWHIEEIEQ